MSCAGEGQDSNHIALGVKFSGQNAVLAIFVAHVSGMCATAKQACQHVRTSGVLSLHTCTTLRTHIVMTIVAEMQRLQIEYVHIIDL